MNAALGDTDGVLGFQIDRYLDDRQQSTRSSCRLKRIRLGAAVVAGCCCGSKACWICRCGWVGAPEISHQCEDWHQFLCAW